MRIKIEKAEEQVLGSSSDQSLELLLTQDDAIRLAIETAAKSREVEKQDLKELFEKVVLDELSIPEYFYLLRNSIKSEAYANVLREIIRNLGKFR